ncbi:Wzz/FepE/Etk N-terminal domain-containing protein [Kineococcus gypseus]|uniref:Wzz/FepE/Etk N-terminal domain-containing protein n=1 Tax=Kineococcus gypseus TaxID=1637102 RepID=UPI003D7CF7D8
MTLREYVRLFRRGWLAVLVLTALGVGAANLLTFVLPSTYTSTASVLVSLRSDGTAGSLQQAVATTQERAPTYASLATSTLVLEDAAGVAGVDVNELRAGTSAAVREGQAFIDVTVRAGSAQAAQSGAQAVAEALGRQAPASDAPASDAPGAGTPLALEVVTPAVLPDAPVSPRPRNNTFFGAVIGLALGIGLVVVAHSLDDRIRVASDLPRGLALATVTSLPLSRSRSARGADVRLESFRHLRANLQFGTRAGGVIAVAGVTSDSTADEVAAQLAAVLGEIRLGVVVVDADLRTRPADARGAAAPAPPAPGVADVLAGSATLQEVLRPGSAEGVWSVPAGTVEGASAQQLSTAPMRALLQELEARFDYVLLSCPPVVERSETSVVAALSRSSLLVVESGSTTRTELLHALELLGGVGATSVSVALDHVRGAEVGSAALPKPAEAPGPVPAPGPVESRSAEVR